MALRKSPIVSNIDIEGYAFLAQNPLVKMEEFDYMLSLLLALLNELI